MEVTPRHIQLPEEKIAEFKKIFKKENGVEYTDEEAYDAAQNLIGFFDFLLRLDERNKYEGRYNVVPDVIEYEELCQKKTRRKHSTFS